MSQLNNEISQLNNEIKNQFLFEFGENIRKIRIQKKLSQTELASRINNDAKKISRIECGLYNFGVASILILAKALDVEITQLFDIKNIEFLKNHIWE